jgi:hypothetical protein
MNDSQPAVIVFLDALPWLLWIGLALFYGLKIIRHFPEFRRRAQESRTYRAENKAREKASRAMRAERRRRDQESPPWIEPRPIDSTMNDWAYSALLDRLEPVDGGEADREIGETTLRDPETGQLWRHYEDEVGFNQFMVLDPLVRPDGD